MSCARHPVALQNMLLLAENFTLKVLTRLAHKVLGISKLKHIVWNTICLLSPAGCDHWLCLKGAAVAAWSRTITIAATCCNQTYAVQKRSYCNCVATSNGNHHHHHHQLELVSDVAVSTSVCEAVLFCARRWAVARPRVSGRRSSTEQQMSTLAA